MPQPFWLLEAALVKRRVYIIRSGHRACCSPVARLLGKEEK
jgi:hypothetical protein